MFVLFMLTWCSYVADGMSVMFGYFTVRPVRLFLSTLNGICEAHCIRNDDKNIVLLSDNNFVILPEMYSNTTP